MKNKITYKKGQPYPLGVKKTDDGVQLCTVISNKKAVTLNLYKINHKNPTVSIPVTEEFMYGDIASIHIIGIDIQQYEYSFEYKSVSYTDEYAVSINKMDKFGENTTFHNKRCSFLPDFDWEGVVCPKLPLEDIILYRLHVRGFTKHQSSNVKHKGTFLGIIEKIPYLKELGINQIELMPAYEFIDKLVLKEDYITKESTEQYRCNYWGYTRENRYFAVKSAYAYGNDASYEFKQLIKELHRNGIEVIMEFYFTENIEFSTVIECLKFWIMEYKIDGFHLNGSVPYIALIAKEPLFADIKLYADYFPINEIIAGKKIINKPRHLGVSAENYKQAVRSFLKSDMGRCEEVASLMRKNDNYTVPINYICSHDGFTMRDMVSYDFKHNEMNGEDNLDGTDYNFSWNCGIEGHTRKKKIIELRVRQMKNAWMLLLFSKGVPAILSGDELCNSQEGNNNVYCQDNSTGWLNWKAPACYEALGKYVKALITIRKEFKEIWHSKSEEAFDSNTKKFPNISYHGEKAWQIDFRPADRSFGIMYFAENNEKDEKSKPKILYIAYNMNWMPQKFALPKLPTEMKWYKAIDTSCENSIMEMVEKVNKTIMVEERSCILLMAK